MQNVIKLNAAVHELWSTRTFLPSLAIAKNPKIRFCDLDFCPMTLKFAGFRAVVKVHVPAKFHQATCNDS